MSLIIRGNALCNFFRLCPKNRILSISYLYLVVEAAVAVRARDGFGHASTLPQRSQSARDCTGQSPGSADPGTDGGSSAQRPGASHATRPGLRVGFVREASLEDVDRLSENPGQTTCHGAACLQRARNQWKGLVLNEHARPKGPLHRRQSPWYAQLR